MQSKAKKEKSSIVSTSKELKYQKSILNVIEQTHAFIELVHSEVLKNILYIYIYICYIYIYNTPTYIMYLANGIVCVSLNLLFFNRGQLLYNVVSVSAIQQCISVITVYIYLYIYISIYLYLYIYLSS